MSLFTKRKGRRISTFDDEDEQGGAPLVGEEDASSSSDPVVQPIRFGKRPLKQSALRRSINVNDDALGADPDESSGPTTADDTAAPRGGGGDDEDDGPVVVRPTIGRSGSRRSKNRLSAASTAPRVSFGGDDEDEDADSAPTVVTPKRRTAATAATAAASGSSLTQRVLETNAFRKSLSGRLPTRQRVGDDDDEDGELAHGGRNRDYGGDDDDGRPRYSQAYLDELQSSTPNTPQNLASARRRQQGVIGGDDDDIMDLDPSELEGAMVVDAAELGLLSPALTGAAPPPPPAAHVLTATEIQERKDRRARRALEQDAIALGSEDDEEGGYISLLPEDQRKKKKEETRLVREDEDLGEGYDEFVEDGRLSLGRKAEREARRQRKKEMADLIKAAEVGGDGGGNDGNDNDDDAKRDASDDSDAERRAAYDEAQTRAGMDGLHQRLADEDDEDGGGGGGVHGSVPIPRMLPLPDLAACLQEMRSAVEALEVDAAQHRRKLAEADQEKEEIAARETEVQAILDTAAAKYQTVLGAAKGAGSTAAANGAATAATTVAAAFTQSPLRPLQPGQSPLRSFPPGLAGEFPVERGLESLGTTPTRRANPDDIF